MRLSIAGIEKAHFLLRERNLDTFLAEAAQNLAIDCRAHTRRTVGRVSNPETQLQIDAAFSKLRQQALVESTRGPGGGYSLARNADKITMADIVAAVDAPSAEELAAEGGWMSSELWASLNEKMLAHLQSISLRQLVAEQRAKGVAVEPAPQPSLKRGVFAKPKAAPMKITAPNSVFALAGSLMPSRG